MICELSFQRNRQKLSIVTEQPNVISMKAITRKLNKTVDRCQLKKGEL